MLNLIHICFVLVLHDELKEEDEYRTRYEMNLSFISLAHEYGMLKLRTMQTLNLSCLP